MLVLHAAGAHMEPIAASTTIYHSPCVASAASGGIYGGVWRNKSMTRKGCEGCVYYRPLNNAAGGERGCHYCLDTGNPRGCSIVGCIRKIKGKPEKRVSPWDGKPRKPKPPEKSWRGIRSGLKREREKAGYAQIEFARILGLPKTTYANYENGNRHIPPEVMEKACEILGVTQGEIAEEAQE